MPAEVFGGISAFKAALDIAKGLKDISDAVSRNQAIIDLQQTILDAQRSQLELLNEVTELKERVRATENKRVELARYEMVDVKNSGEFAYRLKATEAGGRPQHLVCPTCFEKGNISTLHAEGSSNGQDWYVCRACDKSISFGRYVSTQTNRDDHNPYF